MTVFCEALRSRNSSGSSSRSAAPCRAGSLPGLASTTAASGCPSSPRESFSEECCLWRLRMLPSTAGHRKPSAMHGGPLELLVFLLRIVVPCRRVAEGGLELLKSLEEVIPFGAEGASTECLLKLDGIVPPSRPADVWATPPELRGSCSSPARGRGTSSCRRA